MPVVIIVGTFGYPFIEFPTEQVVKLDNQFDDENCFHNFSQFHNFIANTTGVFMSPDTRLSHSSCVNYFNFLLKGQLLTILG